MLPLPWIIHAVVTRLRMQPRAKRSRIAASDEILRNRATQPGAGHARPRSGQSSVERPHVGAKVGMASAKVGEFGGRATRIASDPQHPVKRGRINRLSTCGCRRTKHDPSRQGTRASLCQFGPRFAQTEAQIDKARAAGDRPVDRCRNLRRSRGETFAEYLGDHEFGLWSAVKQDVRHAASMIEEIHRGRHLKDFHANTLEGRRGRHLRRMNGGTPTIDHTDADRRLHG